MKASPILNPAIALLFLFGTSYADGPTRGNHHGHHGTRTIVIDVACDARTFAAIGLADVADEGEEPNEQIARGSTFIVNGKIFPGGTIPDGDDFDLDTATGSIGTWVCRGTFNFNLAEIIEGAVPHVSSIQHYLFSDDGSQVTRHSMASEGQEGGIDTAHRIVSGGTGKYRGLVGEVKQEFLGVNITGLENFRFTFKLKSAR